MLTLRYVLVTLSTILITWSLSVAATLYDKGALHKRTIRSRFHQLQQLQHGSQGRGNTEFTPNRYGGFQNVGNQSEWSMFMPEPPSEDEVDCHVEVEVVHLVGGRCVRLGGERRMAVCQSGIYLDVRNGECRELLRARERAESLHNQDNDDSESTRFRRSGQNPRSPPQPLHTDNDIRNGD